MRDMKRSSCRAGNCVRMQIPSCIRQPIVWIGRKFAPWFVVSRVPKRRVIVNHGKNRREPYLFA